MPEVEQPTDQHSCCEYRKNEKELLERIDTLLGRRYASIGAEKFAIILLESDGEPPKPFGTLSEEQR
jgi:hypothetical protein